MSPVSNGKEMPAPTQGLANRMHAWPKAMESAPKSLRANNTACQRHSHLPVSRIQHAIQNEHHVSITRSCSDGNMRYQYFLSTPGTCNVASKNGGWTSICTSAGKNRLSTQPGAFKQYGQSTMESSQKPFPLRIAKSPGEKPNTVPLSSHAASSAGPNFQ